MDTLHEGISYDIADAASDYAFSTTLEYDEVFKFKLRAEGKLSIKESSIGILECYIYIGLLCRLEKD